MKTLSTWWAVTAIAVTLGLVEVHGASGTCFNDSDKVAWVRLVNTWSTDEACSGSQGYSASAPMVGPGMSVYMAINNGYSSRVQWSCSNDPYDWKDKECWVGWSAGNESHFGGCETPKTAYIFDEKWVTNSSNRRLGYEILIKQWSTNAGLWIPTYTNYFALDPQEYRHLPGFTNDTPTWMTVRNVQDWEGAELQYYNDFYLSTNTYQGNPPSTPIPPTGGNTQLDPIGYGSQSVQPSQYKIWGTNEIQVARENAIGLGMTISEVGDAQIQIMIRQAAYLSNLVAHGSGTNWGSGLTNGFGEGTNSHGFSWTLEGTNSGRGFLTNGLASRNPANVTSNEFSPREAPVWTVPGFELLSAKLGLPVPMENPSVSWGEWEDGALDTWAGIIRNFILVLETLVWIFVMFRIVAGTAGGSTL